jgi:mycofactocin glycosyltransferase
VSPAGQMTIDPVSRWRDMLRLPGESDDVRSGLRELAEYFGISEAAARARCESAVADAKREWESSPRRTAEQVLSFYRTTQSYIFEHVWWHVTDPDNNAGNIALLDFAHDHEVRAYLDFGSGVGANAIVFSRHGIAVTLADVSRSMLDFARWRLERRGLEASYVDLCEQPLPAHRFDLVTAVDVFEHLARPEAEIARIAAALVRGGILVFNDQTGPDPDRPMHIVPHRRAILRGLGRHGLRRAPAADLTGLGYHVYSRSGRGRLADRLWGLFDGLRYGAPVAAAGDTLRACRSRWARARGVPR